ncbi:MAG: glycosyltransferase N-terminal domain-containing protein [Bacteroidota bacterium]
MRLLYSFLIRCYGLAIFIAALFNHKAKLWIEGRKNIFESLKKTIPQNKPVFWIHCASLGEFEQGRPLIEKVKKEQPHYFILLTFFSPSGYEIRKNYVEADAVFYLPLDTKQNAKQFLAIVKPKIVCFVKYEYWFNYINQIYQQNIPIYLVSAILRPNQHFFKWYGKWSLNQLKKITHFFAQDEQTQKLLLANNIKLVTISGDTRFDRVIELVNSRKEITIAKQFSENAKVLVCGSTWPDDDAIIIEALKNNNDLKILVAPHEINENSLAEAEKKYGELGKVIRFSKSNIENLNNARILLIDNIGMLSSLYHYAYISSVGGGFGKGIHNILEAACYGKPVFFGPNFQKFNEAKDLIRLQGAQSVSSAKELETNMNELINNPKLYSEKSKICSDYIASQQGATKKIMEFVFK